MEILLDDIVVDVVRRPVRALRLTVFSDGKVRLVVPLFTSESEACRFVQSKAGWLRKHHAAAASRVERSQLQYVSGEVHMLFGKKLPLRVEYITSRTQGVAFTTENIVLYCRKDSDREKRKALFYEFYRVHLRQYISLHLQQYADLYGETPVNFSIRRMKTEWGSCMARKRNMLFNLELAKVPEHLVDYVIVHELCHLQVQNHGPRFKALMDSRMSDWRDRKMQLKAFAHN